MSHCRQGASRAIAWRRDAVFQMAEVTAARRRASAALLSDGFQPQVRPSGAHIDAARLLLSNHVSSLIILFKAPPIVLHGGVG